MALGFGVEMVSTGFAELAAKLERGAVTLARPTEERMVRAGAQVAKEEMVRRAPLLAEKNKGSDALEPHAIKSGIRVLVVKNSEPVEARVGPRGRRLVDVATDVEYGHRQVHGGSLTLLGNGKTSGKGTAGADVPAHPFVRPTYEATERPAEEAMIAELDKVVAEVLG